MVEHTDLDEVWMVVSPQNPFKKKESLAKDHERLQMIDLAIGENLKLKSSNIEFGMPVPSYTIDTLTVLKEKHPNYHFVLLMGGDNLPTLPKWKNYERLVSDNKIYVYNRPGYDLGPIQHHENITIVEDSPLLQISASFIRRCIKENKSIRYLVTETVFQYIDGSSLYK